MRLLLQSAKMQSFTLCRAGHVTQWCKLSKRDGHAAALRVGLSALGVLVAVAVVAFCCLRWKQVVREFSAARIARIKRRWGGRPRLPCPIPPCSALPCPALKYTLLSCPCPVLLFQLPCACLSILPLPCSVLL